MPPFLRRRSAWLAIGFGLLLLAGIGAFIVALQPCRFVLAPGRELAWTLAVSNADLLPDGSAGTARCGQWRVALVGLGGNDAVLLAGPLGGAPVQSALLRIDGDGTCRRYTGDGRLEDSGEAVAGFDFSLLPLPPGAEQDWKPNVVWAALPEARRSVVCAAKRQRSGARPEFRCDFPASVEWVDAATGRYRQVRGLSAVWKFDNLRGVPLSATVRFRLYDEQPPPGGRRGREVVLELAWLGSSSAGDPARLRAAARAAATVSTWVSARRAPPPEALAELRQAGGPFLGLAESLLARTGR